ncbi:hypothetical protein F751_0847 [Auxenochlorella protothecoides]|uniref:Uncharacterized protein n=1 Tax=Auxenochlorella protothecoides TaxID=3075 RepID=A0A087SPD4_AUXPR|nr:hypothetical protein F751_0847 [Auxenochlorella protothecoides]KFM27588.1 hypothetical protein F751_0847 [Auxenochlorella protothecoides]
MALAMPKNLFASVAPTLQVTFLRQRVQHQRDHGAEPAAPAQGPGLAPGALPLLQLLREREARGDLPPNHCPPQRFFALLTLGLLLFLTTTEPVRRFLAQLGRADPAEAAAHAAAQAAWPEDQDMPVLG